MNIFTQLYEWFYRPISARVVGIYRIGLGIVLFLTAFLFAGHLKEFFSDQGYVTKEFVHQTTKPNGFSIFFFNDSLLLVTILYFVMMVACLFFIFGVWSRFAGFLCYILFLSFYNRLPLIDFDGTVVIIIALFCTLFLQTDKALVPKWYAKKYGTAETVPGWPARLLQVQIAFIYLFAAFTKLRSPSWMAGNELLGILNFQYATMNFSWLTNYPLLVNLLTYGAIASELTFPFWIWFEKMRRWILVPLILMHIGIAITLQVTYFSEVMIACLLLFMTDKDIEDLRSLWRWTRKALPNLRKRFPRIVFSEE